MPWYYLCAVHLDLGNKSRWDKKGKPYCLCNQEHFSGIQERQEWSSTVSLSLGLTNAEAVFGPVQMTAARDPFAWPREIYNLLTRASWCTSFLDRCRTPCGKVANLTNSKPVAEEVKYLECSAHGRASTWWIKLLFSGWDYSVLFTDVYTKAWVTTELNLRPPSWWSY